MTGGPGAVARVVMSVVDGARLLRSKSERSEVIFSMPLSAPWKVMLFCTSCVPTLTSVLTIMSMPIANPERRKSNIKVVISVNPSDLRLQFLIVSLLVFTSESLEHRDRAEILRSITLAVAHVASADRSLQVKTLVSLRRHQRTLGSIELAVNRQMQDVDLANKIGGNADRHSTVAGGIEQVSAAVIGVVGELHVHDVVDQRYRRLTIYLAIQNGCGVASGISLIGQVISYDVNAPSLRQTAVRDFCKIVRLPRLVHVQRIAVEEADCVLAYARVWRCIARIGRGDGGDLTHRPSTAADAIGLTVEHDDVARNQSVDGIVQGLRVGNSGRQHTAAGQGNRRSCEG